MRAAELMGKSVAPGDVAAITGGAQRSSDVKSPWTRIRDGEALVLPAILSQKAVLPGERRVLDSEWAEVAAARDCAIKKTNRQLVVLPAEERAPLELIKVGTLAEVEMQELASAGEEPKVSVFGRDAVNVTLVQRAPFLLVLATVRDRGDEEKDERLAAKARRLAGRIFEEQRVWGPPDVSGLDVWQTMYAVAMECTSGVDPVALLNAESAESGIAVMRRVLPRRRRQRKKKQLDGVLGRRGKTDNALPDAVSRAINDGAGISGGEHREQAVAFLKELKWVAPVPAAIDLAGVEAKLDHEFLGMETVKDAVLDLLATWEWARRAGARQVTGKTLCLLGPPGVGKTSIAAVIAEAMGRELIRVAMGSVDDVYLVGADQSYSNSQPGEIARRIRQSHKHPSELVFLLDEIDKMPLRSQHQALGIVLALLDPTQQSEWRDHFIGMVPLDLSGSVFIATANDAEKIPAPLWDRLQPLELPAYTKEEQVRIGEQHLWPRLKQRLRVDGEVSLRSGVIEALVTGGASVPGMRQLQGQLESVLGRSLRRFLESGESVDVSVEDALSWMPTKPRGHRIGFRVPIDTLGSTATAQLSAETARAALAAGPLPER